MMFEELLEQFAASDADVAYWRAFSAVSEEDWIARTGEEPSDCVGVTRRFVELDTGVKLRNATDGLYALKAGYPCAMLGSATGQAPANYHWPTDTADNVDYGTLADAARVCEALVRRLDDTWI